MLTIETLKAEMQKRIPLFHEDYGVDVFDPWAMFPAILGSYDSEFYTVALGLLCDLRDKTYLTEGLAQDIFREMLCVSGLCDYGTNPRVCFTTVKFAEILPAYIEMWQAEHKVRWDDADT